MTGVVTVVSDQQSKGQPMAEPNATQTAQSNITKILTPATTKQPGFRVHPRREQPPWEWDISYRSESSNTTQVFYTYPVYTRLHAIFSIDE
jgi:hypothetical protein